MNVKSRKTILSLIVANTLFAGHAAAEQINYMKGVKVVDNPSQLQAPVVGQVSNSSRYIVKYKDTDNLKDAVGPVRAAMLNERTNKLQSKAIELESKGSKVHHQMARFNAMSVELNDKQLADLRSSAGVDYVEVDPIRKPLALHAGESAPWGLTPVQATGSFAQQASTGMKVCVIDTGYDYGHPDLTVTGVDGEGNSQTGAWGSPGHSHGTHVAGTIAGIAGNNEGVVGIFPNEQADIYVYKIFNNSGNWPTASDIIVAAQACADNGSQVINMSLGGGGSSNTEANAFTSLLADGVLSIAAAGNDANTAHSYPASYDDVVSVAAVDSNNDHAYFSQRTNQVELSGPGVSVRSTVIRGDGRDANIEVGGTSYAAQTSVVPHLRYVASGSSYSYSPYNGTASADLFSCSTSQSGNVNCSGASGSICVVERSDNESDGYYPERDAVEACESSGGVGAIVYSKSDLPGVQSNYLLDDNSAFTFPTVSVDRATGLALAGLSGQSATVTVAGNTDYEYYNGTSMATPHVAGVAALVWSYHQTCSASEIRSALAATALDLHTSGRDNYTGHGLVQAQDAVDYLNANGCSGDTTNPGEVTGFTETDLSAARRDWLYFTIDVPSGATDLTVTMSGGTGDADLYVNDNGQPTTSSYECRPYTGGNNETCQFSSPAAGTWYIGIRGYRAFSGVTLEAQVTE